MSSPTILAIETWDSYGVQPSMPSYAPYQVLTGGTAPTDFTLNSIANPPWNPNGNGIYLRISGGSSAPSPGSGVYRKTGNLYQALCMGFWFRPVALIAGVAFWRCNDSNGGQVYGMDQSFLTLDASGHIEARNSSNTVLGTAASPLVANTWYFIEVFILIGDATGAAYATGQIQVNISGGSFANSTVLITNTNCQTRANNASYVTDSITLDREFTTVADFHFGPYYIMDPQGNGAAALLGSKGMYYRYIAPSSDVSKQFTPSTGTTDYSIAASVPPGANYVSAASSGLVDQYSYPAQASLGAITAVATRMVVESDAGGARVVTPKLTATGTEVGAAHGCQNGAQQVFDDVLAKNPSGGAWSAIPTSAGPEVLI